MKNTIEIKVTEEKQDFIWLVVCKHTESEHSKDWFDQKAFHKYEDARDYMCKELKRVGENMGKSYPITYAHKFSCYDEISASAVYTIYDMKHNIVDEYKGYVYYLPIE